MLQAPPKSKSKKEPEKAVANIAKLPQELSSETKKITEKKDSLSKPECKLEELLKASPKSQRKKELNKNLPSMSTQSRYSFLPAKPQDEKNKEKKKQEIKQLCL